MVFPSLTCLCILGSTIHGIHGASGRPHVITLVADDLGFNDVGFHGTQQIPTPNIDALAWNGVIMNRYYSGQICTPSRASLLTGRHFVSLGMQEVHLSSLPYCLPLDVKIMPQYFRDLDYKTYLIGKWHLGLYKKDCTPLRRGYDHYVGILSGHCDYYHHCAEELVSDNTTNVEQWATAYGMDIRKGFEPAYDLHGQYTTHIFRNESIKVIKEHSENYPDSPMLLNVHFTAPHSADSDPLQAPADKISEIEKKIEIEDYKRRVYAAMVSELDDAIGEIIGTLQKVGMLNNSIIVFVSDNGGPPAGYDNNYASNWPLRGGKGTLYEGGIRVPAAIWGSMIKKTSRVSNQVMHVMDVLPTLLTAAGANDSITSNLEGQDQWDAIYNGKESDTNRTILHMSDPIFYQYGFTKGDWKLINGDTLQTEYRYWYDPESRGRNGSYDFEAVINSPAFKALSSIRKSPSIDEISELRKQATIYCVQDGTTLDFDKVPICNQGAPSCLFNTKEDPCELNNVAAEYPEILAEMEEELSLIKENTPYPLSGLVVVYEPGLPEHNNYVWDYFGDIYNLP